MQESLIEETISIMEQLNIFSYGFDTIDTIKSGNDIDDDFEFSNLINEATQQPDNIKNLIKNLSIIREDPKQDKFWDALSQREQPPAVLQVFAYGLITTSETTAPDGVLLYSILIGMMPITHLWNHLIFNALLAVMVQTTQFISSHPKKLSEDHIENMKLSISLFKSLSKSFSEQFIELAGNDIIVAIIELSMKMVVVYDKIFYGTEKYYEQLSKAGFDLLDRIKIFRLKLILPYLVTSLLLDFIPNNKTIDRNIVEIRSNLLEFSKSSLRESQKDLILLMKHIAVRCPERAAMRGSAVLVLIDLLSILEDKQPYFVFMFKLSQSLKASYRVLAMLFYQSLVIDAKLSIPDHILIDVVETIVIHISEINPQVRAASLNSLASIVLNSSSKNVQNSILLNNLYPYLKYRIHDEKLAVRKASLNLLRSYIQSRDEEPDFVVFELIAERLRDRSNSLKQDAANLLTECLNKFHHPKIIRLWFDSILPLCIDPDDNTQKTATNILLGNYLNIISMPRGDEMTECLDLSHIELLNSIIPIYKQKAINLRSLCKSVQKHLLSQPPLMFWKIAEILVGLTPNHFKKNFSDVWDSRDKYPVEYYSIISILGDFTYEITNDCLKLIDDIAESRITKCTEGFFILVHSCLQIISKSYQSAEGEFLKILEKSNGKINNVLGDEFATKNDLFRLLPIVYMVGELILLVKKVGDLDFSGLKLLISDYLPNQVNVPTNVRAIATISLGKLCVQRRDISSSFVAAFVAQLHKDEAAPVKCNALVVLCDLCVKYSASVDPYIMSMTSCFADKSNVVRRQALLIITRLISEDYIKLRPIILYRYVHSIVDENESVASFARNCLFDVLKSKFPNTLSDNFIDILKFFNDFCIEEDQSEYNDLFRLTDKTKRRKAFTLILENITSSSLYEILGLICNKILSEMFLDQNISIEEGEQLLSDVFYVMMTIENDMESVTVHEANSEDDVIDRFTEQTRIFMGLIHKNLISSVLPILNQMHRYLKQQNSPLQSDLRKFFRRLCVKHPQLIDELQKQEPILASELRHDISLEETSDDDELTEATPVAEPFRSPILSRIAQEAQGSRPGSNNNTLLSNPELEGNESNESEKQLPVLELNLDDDE